MNSNKYDETISTSKQESLLKAIAIFREEEARREKESVQRPGINVKRTVRGLIALFTAFFVIAAVSVVLFVLTRSWIPLPVGAVLLLLYSCLTAKKFVISSILLYQQVAPERIRLSCVFKPSCSAYMLLAIEKFGLIKGLFRGIKRLLRCHPPNGGTDNP